MKPKDEKTLVNFRVASEPLNAFDDACRLAGSTRTDILVRLLKSYTEVSADQLPKKLAEERRSFKTLKSAVRSAERRRRALTPLKPFSALRARPRQSLTSFLNDDMLSAKRS